MQGCTQSQEQEAASALLSLGAKDNGKIDKACKHKSPSVTPELKLKHQCNSKKWLLLAQETHKRLRKEYYQSSKRRERRILLERMASIRDLVIKFRNLTVRNVTKLDETMPELAEENCQMQLQDDC